MVFRGSNEMGLRVCHAVCLYKEILGGYIMYSTLINPTHHLAGKLKGLVTRYDPLPPLSLTLMNAAQADT